MKTIFFGLMMLMSTSVFAQTEHGNGGDVLLKGQNYYLLDFVEAGIEKTATISNTVMPSKELMEMIQQKLPLYPQVAVGVAQKMAEISMVSPTLFAMLLETFNGYQWSFVDSALKQIKDATTTLQFPNSSLYQIAARKGFRIQINQTLFQSLAKSNQVGLVFHEMLYAMSNEQKNSDRAREVNGVLFSSDVSQMSVSNLNQYLEYLGLPKENGGVLRKLGNFEYASNFWIVATAATTKFGYDPTYIGQFPEGSFSSDVAIEKFAIDACARRMSKVMCTDCPQLKEGNPHLIGLSAVGTSTYGNFSETGVRTNQGSYDGFAVLESDRYIKRLEELKSDQECVEWITSQIKSLIQEIQSKPVVTGI